MTRIGQMMQEVTGILPLSSRRRCSIPHCTGRASAPSFYAFISILFVSHYPSLSYGQPQAQECTATPPQCNSPSTTTTVTLDCAGLKAHQFSAGQKVELSDPKDCKLQHSIVIDAPNTILVGKSAGFTFIPDSTEISAAVLIRASNVLVENVTIKGGSSTRFEIGLWVESGWGDVSIHNVNVIAASDSAGIQLPSNGSNNCVWKTTVNRAGGSGFRVKEEGSGGGSVDFRAAHALSNDGDGFSIQHLTAVSNLGILRIWRSEARGNRGDGFDLGGNTVEFLCSSARENSSPISDRANGIIRFGSGPIRIENGHFRNNEGVGVVATAGGPVEVVSSTFANNDLPAMGGSAGEQIDATNLLIYNSVAVGPRFVSPATSIQGSECENNLYTHTSGAPPSQCPGQVQTITFLQSSGVLASTDLKVLGTGNPNDGVDDAIDPATVAFLW